MNQRSCYLLLALALLGFGAPTRAQSYLQSKASSLGSSGNISATFTSQPVAGNTIIAGVVCYGSTGCTISSVTDSASNTYTQIGPAPFFGGPTNNITKAVLFCASGISSGASFAVTAALSNGTGGDSNLYIAEYSGVTCNVDQSASGSDTGTSATVIQTSSVTTTNAADLLVALAASASGGTPTPGIGYALRQNGNNGVAEDGGFEDQVVTTTGSYSGVMNLPTSTQYWAMSMVALKATSGSGGGGTVLASDNFNRANQSPIGSPWTNFQGNAQIISNALSPAVVTANTSAAVIYTGITWPNDQFSQASLTQLITGEGYAALVLRHTTGGDYYYCGFDASPGFGGMGTTTTIHIWRFVGGALTSLTSGFTTPHVNDVFSCQVVGSAISFSQNGTVLLSATDSSPITSGSAGLFVQSAAATLPNVTDITWDNWSGGIPSGSGGTIAYVQSKTNALGTGGNISATFSTTPIVGDTIVVGDLCYGPSGCPISSVTDNFGNAYSKIGPTATFGGPTANITNAVLYCATATSSGSNFTVTVAQSNGSGGDSNLYIAEYSGASCNVDQSASGSLTGGTATTLMQTSSATTANASDLLVAVAGATSGGVATAGTGFSLRQNGNSGVAEFGGFEDRIVSATGSYNASMSLASSTQYWAMVMVALKGSSGSSGSARTIATLSPPTGSIGSSVTITGTNFGSTPTSDTVTFSSGKTAQVTSGNSTVIIATVPLGAITGPVVVTVGGLNSNGKTFTVTSSSSGPNITGITPNSGNGGNPGTQVTISGRGFGASQGSGLVWLGSKPGSVVTWTDTQVVATVVSGSSTGFARVLQNGVWSNSVPFTINNCF